jgi:hypothetical protein
MVIDQWARKWNISDLALDELKVWLGLAARSRFLQAAGVSENGVQARVRLEASQKGCRLWRNNVGATNTPEGGFLRYGLANDSANMNRVVKSADLIGIRPVKITADMTGIVIGQFLSREVKNGKWTYSGTDRERAQLAWIELIISLGGDAGFATGEGTI